MKKEITYNVLFGLDQELMALQRKAPALSLLLEPRIKFFYQRADIQIKCMMEGLDRIKKQFIQQDEKENFRTIKNGEVEEWMFKPVYTDFKNAAIISDPALIRKAFEEKVAEFMNTTITIEL